MFTLLMKFAEIGAVTNRNAMINNSWNDPSPKTNDAVIDANNSAPIPTVPTFVGACRRVIASLKRSRPIAPTSVKSAPTNRKTAAA